MCGFDCCFFLKIWSLEGGELGWRHCNIIEIIAYSSMLFFFFVQIC